jgi:two-component system phosphate regulon sensor histidine kinase PhoR
MNNKRYRYILYFIVAVIVTTIAIQVYWNYKNYLNSKQQLVNDVQTSLDKAIDDYYADLAERTTFGIFIKGDEDKKAFDDNGSVTNILKKFDSLRTNPEYFNSDTLTKNNNNITVLRGLQIDSMEQLQEEAHSSLSPFQFKNKIDSIKSITGVTDSIKNIEVLTSKIIVSFSNDTLNLQKVDSLFKVELNRKQIAIDYELVFKSSKDKLQTIKSNFTNSIDLVDNQNQALSTSSKSTFLPKKSTLNIYFNNITSTILKRILSGIIISTILILAIISCLFYLLKVINHQKQLAEIKNDLISNITHEFKTPIATISAALEGMSTFNAIDDKNKSRHYINMSANQLSKLNTMVEKLLETATLDSNELELNKEEINLSKLIQAAVNSFKNQHPDKTFIFNNESDTNMTELDVFHFENTINNILDNAVKYGGNTIEVAIKSSKNIIEIDISDNGNSLKPSEKDRIFDKFYRVPKGNTHDVKGFGIGLFYSKTIIEKHGGSIHLDLSNNLTTFKIKLPHGF